MYQTTSPLNRGSIEFHHMLCYLVSKVSFPDTKVSPMLLQKLLTSVEGSLKFSNDSTRRFLLLKIFRCLISMNFSDQDDLSTLRHSSVKYLFCKKKENTIRYFLWYGMICYTYNFLLHFIDLQ